MPPIARSPSFIDAVVTVRAQLREFFRSDRYEQVALLFVLVHLWLMMLYGALPRSRDYRVLDKLGVAFLFFHTAEVLARVWAFGPFAFVVAPRNFFREMANRFDIAIVSLSVVAFLWSRAQTGRTEFRPWEDGTLGLTNDAARIAIVLPTFRLFSTVRRVRSLVFSVAGILPNFANVALLMLLVIFVFVIAGTQLLAGKFQFLDEDVFSAPQINFNSCRDSFATLFKLLIGEWGSIMFAAVDATGHASVVIYFIAFFVLVTLLFSNMLVGIIIGAFQKIELLKGRSAKGKLALGDLKSALLRDDDYAGNEHVDLVLSESAGFETGRRRQRRVVIARIVDRRSATEPSGQQFD